MTQLVVIIDIAGEFQGMGKLSDYPNMLVTDAAGKFRADENVYCATIAGDKLEQAKWHLERSKQLTQEAHRDHTQPRIHTMTDTIAPQAGKRYRMRNGAETGAMLPPDDENTCWYTAEPVDGYYAMWNANGTDDFFGPSRRNSQYDLIAEVK